MTALPAIPLPSGIRSRFVENINGLRVHVLEAGHETGGRPCVLLLHGFPELAYSWRKVMPALAEAGYHVIAPDQRGYGRTTGWDNSYDADPDAFRILNMVRDFFGKARANAKPATDAPVRIMAFRSDREYNPSRISESERNAMMRTGASVTGLAFARA